MDKMNEQNLTFKRIDIALFGETLTGKTEICNSYLDNFKYENRLATMYIDKFETKFTLKNEKKINLILWDTPGVPRLRSQALIPLGKAQGVILVFDVTNKSSFNNLNIWLKEIKERSPSIPIFLFGNKVDKNKDKWVMTSEEAKNFAEKNWLTYFEVSAETKQGINEGISYIVNNIYEKLEKEKNIPPLKINNQFNDDRAKCVGKGKNNKKKSK